MGRKKKTEDPTIEALLLAAEKEFGEGAVFDVSKNVISKTPTISYGSRKFDRATGGMPLGRILEFYGPESSGKTTAALHAIKSAQEYPRFIEEGRKALFVDVEHALDLDYAIHGIGVHEDRLLVSQPSTAEAAIEFLIRFVSTGKVSIAVLDSVAALTPREELEGTMTDQQMGLQARVMSKGLRKLKAVAQQTDTSIIFINQLRMKIGVMFGNPEVTPGGNALKYYASQRIDIRPTGENKSIKDSAGNAIGHPKHIKVVKNKIAAPFKREDILITFGVGIDPHFEVLDMGAELDIVTKSGAWYSYGEHRIGQGMDNSIAYLKSNTRLFNLIAKHLDDYIAGNKDITPRTLPEETE